MDPVNDLNSPWTTHQGISSAIATPVTRLLKAVLERGCVNAIDTRVGYAMSVMLERIVKTCRITRIAPKWISEEIGKCPLRE